MQGMTSLDLYKTFSLWVVAVEEEVVDYHSQLDWELDEPIYSH
jgi:hypothetical protein